MQWSVKRNERFRSDRGKLCELCDFCASVNHGMRAEVLVEHWEGRQHDDLDWVEHTRTMSTSFARCVARKLLAGLVTMWSLFGLSLPPSGAATGSTTLGHCLQRSKTFDQAAPAACQDDDC